MSPDEIIIVSGFGRCGSSCTMQMLVAGGLDPGRARYPAYEDGRQTAGVGFDWLPEYKGKVLKWLDPLQYPPIPGYSYRVIWTSRHPHQQALSHAKLLLRNRGWKMTRKERNNVMGRIKRDTKRAIQAWRDVGAVLKITAYERILLDPLSVGIQLAEFVSEGLNLEKMASVVESRTAACREGFLEEDLAKRGVKHDSST